MLWSLPANKGKEWFKEDEKIAGCWGKGMEKRGQR